MKIPGPMILWLRGTSPQRAWRYVAGVVVLLLVGHLYAATQGTNEVNRVIRIDKNVGLSDFKPMSDLAIPGKAVPEVASRDFYSASIRTGIFESAAGILQVKDWPQDEVITILSGNVVVTDTEGRSNSFAPGDSFVLPKGFSGTWEMKTRIREHYVFGPRD